MEREHSQNRKMQTKSFLQYNRPIQAAAVYFNQHTKLVQLKSTKSYGREKIFYAFDSSSGLSSFIVFTAPCTQSTVFRFFPRKPYIRQWKTVNFAVLASMLLIRLQIGYFIVIFTFYLRGRRHDLVYAWLFVMCLRKQ